MAHDRMITAKRIRKHEEGEQKSMKKALMSNEELLESIGKHREKHGDYSIPDGVKRGGKHDMGKKSEKSSEKGPSGRMSLVHSMQPDAAKKTMHKRSARKS